MVIEKQYKVSIGKKVEKLVYAILFVLITLYIFAANDETLAIHRLLELQYLIPCVVYSFFVMLVVMGISKTAALFIKSEVVTLVMSIFLGSVVGLFALARLTDWLLR